ncbi:hypothetical protein [Aureivirga sp. CE67]|uniref:hypothetical protein n=1 Tax=Aureivirga sp. CE67 TaxID=1788983 RepID=UPI0018CA7E31|nr:hypothetical protein [Aureivirga sp. CE67]
MRKRFKNKNPEEIIKYYKGKGWIIEGLIWGAFMLVFNEFLLNYLIYDSEFTLKSIIISIWIFVGLIFGYFNSKIIVSTLKNNLKTQ